MEARVLYQQGVEAIRVHKDLEEGQRLLTRALQLDPSNDMAWVWLSRTLDDPKRKKQSLERALKLNPANTTAQSLYQKLQGSAVSNPLQQHIIRSTTTVKAVNGTNGHNGTKANGAKSNGVKAGAALAGAAVSAGMVGADGELVKDAPTRRPTPKAPTMMAQRQIQAHLKKADALLEQGQDEDAIEQWVRVLELQVDHEVALRHAVKHLVRLGFKDDGKELIYRAVEAGTQHPPIYLTAIDFAKSENDNELVEELALELASLPTADDVIVMKLVEDALKYHQEKRAEELLKTGLRHLPESQKLLIALGDLRDAQGEKAEAARLYDRAASMGRTKDGREADKRLANFTPILTDKERGSVALASREVAGIGAFYLLLAWQDAGLDLLRLHVLHWLGLILSVVGGYLLVTATSSPQQIPLVRVLGGKVEQGDAQKRGDFAEETALPILALNLRAIMGTVGAVLLILAFWMVFGESIRLLFDPVPPDLSSLIYSE